jgi:hypothetical protein
VRDEIFGAKFTKCDFFLAREGMTRVHDEDDRVGIDADGFELRIFRWEGYDAELDVAAEDVLGDAAGESSLSHNRDIRALVAEAVEHGQQIEAGVFVGGEIEMPALEGPQLFERGAGFVAQLEQAFGIFAQKLAGGGQRSFA